MTERRGRSAAELAERWRVPETVALGFLWHFRDLGLATESRGLWLASPRLVDTGYSEGAA